MGFRSRTTMPMEGTIDVGVATEFPYVPLEVTRGDIMLGSIAFGFYFGFAVRATWAAIGETRRASRFSPYVIMLWIEIAANTTYAVIAWCYLAGYIPPSIGFFVAAILCWAAQVQCLMLIIVNRLCILLSTPRKRLQLNVIVAGIVTVITISTACVWVPGQLQVNRHFIRITPWWDRCEKIIYLFLDLSLNVMFVRMVKSRLISYGLIKYNRVMKFNEKIIIISIGMDVLLLGATALQNPFVYTTFHPITYIVKLQIEISMSRLLIKVARSTGINVYNEEKANMTSESNSGATRNPQGIVAVHIDTQVYTHNGDGEDFELTNQKNRTVRINRDDERLDAASQHEHDIKINDSGDSVV